MKIQKEPQTHSDKRGYLLYARILRMATGYFDNIRALAATFSTGMSSQVAGYLQAAPAHCNNNHASERVVNN